MQTKTVVQRERPLRSKEKLLLVLSGAGLIVLCYGFWLAAILLLLIVLALDFLFLLAAIRFLAVRWITPLIKQHTALLWILVPRFWRRTKITDYQLRLEQAQAPRLFVILDQIAQRIGIASPSEVSIEMSANASVRLKGFRSGRGKTILSIGYDLLAGLSVEQVEAVLAHEMGHAKFIQRGLKSLLTKTVRVIGDLVSPLSSRVEIQRIAGKNYDLEAMFVICANWLTRTTALVLATYSRQDEFAADRISAELFGSEALSSALVRLEQLEEKTQKLPWTERVARLEITSFSQWLSNELASPAIDVSNHERVHVHDAYSTHPSLQDRIAALPADGRNHGNSEPAMQLLVEPDRIAEKLINEIQRIVAERELEDTKSLAAASRKSLRTTSSRFANAPGLMLAIAAVFAGFMYLVDGSIMHGALLGAAAIVVILIARRLAQYRDRVPIPVPTFAAIRAAAGADDQENLSERELNIEAELNNSFADRGARQEATALVDAARASLKDCDYLRANAAGRLALKCHEGCIEAEIVLTVAAAGLARWQQMQINMELVRQHTGFATPSVLWAGAWASSLAGDWTTAEALLWRLLEKEPANPTFLMLLALAQWRQDKLQSAILNAGKAVSLQPDQPENTKLLMESLLDAGRLKEAEKRLVIVASLAAGDAEASMLVVRLRLLRHDLDAALDAARALLQANGNPVWLIRLGEAFETARCNNQAATFFEDALKRAHYPEALLGLARLAAGRGRKDEARRYLFASLNLEQDVGTGGRTVVQLFHNIVAQLRSIEDPRENCFAWIATFPAEVVPPVMANQSLLIYATALEDAERYLDDVLKAMQPNLETTPAVSLPWYEAPNHQQPARPVREGVQCAL